MQASQQAREATCLQLLQVEPLARVLVCHAAALNLRCREIVLCVFGFTPRSDFKVVRCSRASARCPALYQFAGGRHRT